MVIFLISLDAVSKDKVSIHVLLRLVFDGRVCRGPSMHLLCNLVRNGTLPRGVEMDCSNEFLLQAHKIRFFYLNCLPSVCYVIYAVSAGNEFNLCYSFLG